MYNHSKRSVIFINSVYFFTFSSNNKQDYSNIARAFVIEKASKIIGVTPTELEFAKTENGKPYFKNFSDFNFNISHTDGAIAICFSDYPVGVDIEKIRPFNPKVTNRYFTETEKAYIQSDIKNISHRFFEIWTKKEAYIKCHGLTLKELKNTNTSHIHTFQKGEYIISVCSECEKSKLIVLENFNNI